MTAQRLGSPPAGKPACYHSDCAFEKCGYREGNTPPRSVRVPDAVWEAATSKAKADGTTVTAVILVALTKYGKSKAKKTST